MSRPQSDSINNDGPVTRSEFLAWQQMQQQQFQQLSKPPALSLQALLGVSRDTAHNASLAIKGILIGAGGLAVATW